MRKFFNYESYAAWRSSSGGASTEPVKLVGEGCFDWEEKFNAREEIRRLRAEVDRAREAYDQAKTDRDTMMVKMITAHNDAIEAAAALVKPWEHPEQIQRNIRALKK